MTTREIVLGSKRAIAPSEAQGLAREAAKYAANVQISTGSKSINAKSVMGMISMGSGLQSPVRVLVDGRDEAAAIEAICAMLGKILGV